MKFLLDAQLPPALALWLRQAGYDAQHIQDLEMLNASDSAIWEWALQHGAIIVTKDEDFATRAAQSGGAASPVIVWLRVGNTTNRELKLWFDPRLPGIVRSLQQGTRVMQVI